MPALPDPLETAHHALCNPQSAVQGSVLIPPPLSSVSKTSLPMLPTEAEFLCPLPSLFSIVLTTKITTKGGEYLQIKLRRTECLFSLCFF